MMYVPHLGPAIPKRGNAISRWIGRAVLRAGGFKFEGEVPDGPKFVIIVVPHTSNWDFIVGVGALLDKAHAALHMLGVNHPAVENLVQVARATPGTLGAKLTGAGGGGSMFALTERPQAVAEAIKAAGGTAYVVRLGGPGVQWVGAESMEGLPAPSAAPAADETAT